MTGIDQDDVLGSIQPQILTITHDLLKFAFGEMEDDRNRLLGAIGGLVDADLLFKVSLQLAITSQLELDQCLVRVATGCLEIHWPVVLSLAG